MYGDNRPAIATPKGRTPGFFASQSLSLGLAFGSSFPVGFCSLAYDWTRQIVQGRLLRLRPRMHGAPCDAIQRPGTCADGPGRTVFVVRLIFFSFLLFYFTHICVTWCVW